MKSEYRYIRLTVWMSLLGLILLTGCTKDDEGDKPIELVNAQFSFSLPLKGTRMKGHTRMDENVVQAENTPFRGIDDVRLLCFDELPTANNSKIGDIIEISSSSSDITSNDVDYSECQEIRVPINTDHFGFYATAALDAPLTTHADKMKYGVVEIIGLSKGSYVDNSKIRFRPVPICTSNELLGGSKKGQALLTFLNELMNITASGDNVVEPNDKWSTVNNLYLNEAYQRMTQLTTLSSFNVQTMLTTIYRTANIVLGADELLVPDTQGSELAQAITDKIDTIGSISYIGDDIVFELDENYQGFPMDLGIPAGAARIKWDAVQGVFVTDKQAYGGDLNVLSINDYAYPMNLQYQIFSDILASDQLVIQPDPENQPGTYNDFNDWDAVIDAYTNNHADTKVKSTTQSVVMKQKVEYAVGCMALQACIDDVSYLYDANQEQIDFSPGDFVLKGYIIGGQHEVGYNFQSLEDETGVKEYAIYDSYLNGTSTPPILRKVTPTAVTYILGLGTKSNKTINIAMEIENKGQAFQGADGVIPTGATFYLVAELDPKQGSSPAGMTYDQIFDRDHVTTVLLTITQMGLATATYGMPNLEVPHPTVGLNVDLSWQAGLYYEEVPLSRYTSDD